MKKTHLQWAAALLLSSTAIPSFACSDEPFIGEICVFAAPYCPKGFLPATGSVMQPQSSAALFSLISNVYGGDGRTTFNLPDLRGRSVVGTGRGDYNNPPTLTLGQKQGQESLTLASTQVPAMIGALKATTTATTPTSTPQAGSLLTATSLPGPGSLPMIYAAAGAGGPQVALGGTGGGGAAPQPMATLAPNIGLTVCIVQTGVYPPRP